MFSIVPSKNLTLRRWRAVHTYKETDKRNWLQVNTTGEGREERTTGAVHPHLSSTTSLVKLNRNKLRCNRKKMLILQQSPYTEQPWLHFCLAEGGAESGNDALLVAVVVARPEPLASLSCCRSCVPTSAHENGYRRQCSKLVGHNEWMNEWSWAATACFLLLPLPCFCSFFPYWLYCFPVRFLCGVEEL